MDSYQTKEIKEGYQAEFFKGGEFEMDSYQTNTTTTITTTTITK